MQLTNVQSILRHYGAGKGGVDMHRCGRMEQLDISGWHYKISKDEEDVWGVYELPRSLPIEFINFCPFCGVKLDES